MEKKKQSHRNYYRVLVIPDDQDEPKALSISLQRLKVLKIAAIVLGLHLIGGVVFYFLYFNLHKKHTELIATNKQLEDNNQRINKLMADLQALESYQEKIRKALGAGSMGGSAVRTIRSRCRRASGASEAPRPKRLLPKRTGSLAGTLLC